MPAVNLLSSVAIKAALKAAQGADKPKRISTGAGARNPAADLRDALPPVPTRHLAAIVEPQRAAERLRAMGDCAGNPVTRPPLALSALLFLGPGDRRQLEWAWGDNTINAALRRMGLDRETATAHGFRAMARTLAVEGLGIAPEVIEAQLAHAKCGPLGAPSTGRNTWISAEP